MLVRRLRIRNFRGIRAADIQLRPGVNCLLGPGDVGKTTVLDAIEWVTLPRWHLGATDADFFQCDVKNSIEIEVTVSPVPKALLPENQFGLHQRGWDVESGERHDEPFDEHESCLTIRLVVDASLEPVWEVVTDRHPDGRRINAHQRRELGVHRLGENVERHLGWGRGSALLQITNQTHETERVLADLHRHMRALVGEHDLEELADAVEAVRSRGSALAGLANADRLHASLDPSEVDGRGSMLSLHAEGEIPIRSFGTGSRRLVAMAVQGSSVDEGAVLLIDEIERGLEPFRLRHVLQIIARALRSGSDDGLRLGQTILTTHSPTAICELPASSLNVVRCLDDGTLEVQTVHEDLQGLVRSQPEALLSRAALVAEGKTEEGLLRGLQSFFAGRRGAPLATRGVAIVNGEGSKAPDVARNLSLLGYRTALFADSDVTLSPTESQLRGDGVEVIQWPDAVATEGRACIDLPIEGLNDLLMELRQAHGNLVTSVILGNLVPAPSSPGETVQEWIDSGLDEQELRRAMTTALKDQRWLKRVDHGERLARVVEAHWDSLGSGMKSTIERFEAWAYAE